MNPFRVLDLPFNSMYYLQSFSSLHPPSPCMSSPSKSQVMILDPILLISRSKQINKLITGICIRVPGRGRRRSKVHVLPQSTSASRLPQPPPCRPRSPSPSPCSSSWPPRPGAPKPSRRSRTQNWHQTLTNYFPKVIFPCHSKFSFFALILTSLRIEKYSITIYTYTMSVNLTCKSVYATVGKWLFIIHP